MHNQCRSGPRQSLASNRPRRSPIHFAGRCIQTDDVARALEKDLPAAEAQRGRQQPRRVGIGLLPDDPARVRSDGKNTFVAGRRTGFAATKGFRVFLRIDGSCNRVDCAIIMDNLDCLLCAGVGPNHVSGAGIQGRDGLAVTERNVHVLVNGDKTPSQFGRPTAEGAQHAFPRPHRLFPEHDAAEGIAGDQHPLCRQSERRGWSLVDNGE